MIYKLIIETKAEVHPKIKVLTKYRIFFILIEGKRKKMREIKFKTPKTISEIIYQFIKKEIIDGKLNLKQRIQEKQIAELFGVSTTPVRESFQRLSSEGYLQITARREVIVAGATLEEIQDLFEVVRVLDAYATKKVIHKLSDKDINELKKTMDKLTNYYKNKKVRMYFKENLKFHDLLWEKSDNKFLYKSLAELAEKSAFYANQLALHTPSYLDSSYKDHVEIMKAIEKRDENEVKRLLISHWGIALFDK